jgi:peptidoglycan/LPS O-acetylase OafA/YrhL
MAIAGAATFLAAWDWIFSPETVTPYRWLLLLLAFVFGIASLPLRGTSQRHAEQMVNAAGLAILAIGVTALRFFEGIELPNFWELVVLAAGLGLVAYSAADRAPGPAYLGFANLAAFVVAASTSDHRTLEWWPLLLILGGLIVLAFGLRPRAPLPPEPSSYRAGDLPLAARTDDVTVRVRRD